MTMYKALDLKDYIDRLYVSRKEGGRRPDSIGNHIEPTIQELEEYMQ